MIKNDVSGRRLFFLSVNAMLESIFDGEIEVDGNVVVFVNNFMIDLTRTIDIMSGKDALISCHDLGELYILLDDLMKKVENGGEKDADNNKSRRNDTENNPLSF